MWIRDRVSVVRNPHYVMILKTENSMTHYRILLRDGTWQECDQNGNFQKMVVEEYKEMCIRDRTYGRR